MPGTVSQNSTAGFSGDMPMKPVNQFTLSWVDIRGNRHQAQIEVSRKELQDPRVIMLVINDAAPLQKAWFHAGPPRP